MNDHAKETDGENHKSNALSENPITISEQRTKLMTVKSVAAILERELASTIKEWLKQVKLVPDLTIIPLSDSDRTGHLPKLFEDVLNRLAAGGANRSFPSLHPRTEGYGSRKATLPPC